MFNLIKKIVNKIVSFFSSLKEGINTMIKDYTTPEMFEQYAIFRKWFSKDLVTIIKRSVVITVIVALFVGLVPALKIAAWICPIVVLMAFIYRYRYLNVLTVPQKKRRLAKNLLRREAIKKRLIALEKNIVRSGKWASASLFLRRSEQHKLVKELLKIGSEILKLELQLGLHGKGRADSKSSESYKNRRRELISSSLKVESKLRKIVSNCKKKRQTE